MSRAYRSLRDDVAMRVLPALIERTGDRLRIPLVVAQAFAIADQFMLRRAMVHEDEVHMATLVSAFDRPREPPPNQPAPSPVGRLASMGCLEGLNTHLWGVDGLCARCHATPDTVPTRLAAQRAMRRFKRRGMVVVERAS